MRRHQGRRRARRRFLSDSSDTSDYDSDLSEYNTDRRYPMRQRQRRLSMKCRSCKVDYDCGQAGTCCKCYERSGATEEELKREIDVIKAKTNFLLLLPINLTCLFDVVLVACGSSDSADSPPIPAHRAVLMSRSPVFKAMLENEMKESLSGTIKIRDTSYDALHAFVNYLYTAEAVLDEITAFDLLALAEKYQVQHLKTHCEEHLMSRLKWQSSLRYYAFARKHAAKSLHDVALSMIMKNISKLREQERYREFLAEDPHVVIGIYEAYHSKQANSAANRGTTKKP